MKTNDQQLGVTAAAEVGRLLELCKVPALQACTKAGIYTTTIMRWRNGSKPRRGQLDVMRLAILEVADAAGTLPDELRPVLAELREVAKLPAGASKQAGLAHRVNRLERAVTELGAVL